MEALGLGVGPDRNEGTVSSPDGKCRLILRYSVDLRIKVHSHRAIGTALFFS